MWDQYAMFSCYCRVSYHLLQRINISQEFIFLSERGGSCEERVYQVYLKKLWRDCEYKNDSLNYVK